MASVPEGSSSAKPDGTGPNKPADPPTSQELPHSHLVINASHRRLILVGDITDHWGLVITGSDTVKLFGHGIVRKGDLVQCPILTPYAHGINQIIEGDPRWTADGRPVAMMGHRSECGCKLIAHLGLALGSEAHKKYFPQDYYRYTDPNYQDLYEEPQVGVTPGLMPGQGGAAIPSDAGVPDGD
ncbi:PAAR domain-containing protein [Paraburkholderia sp. Tr-20389]|uniref:PAAR domain-containing protein n=1 Tax=Paraburkholderia sp. Tr-20389 TaxID=2703903 RepID=UPI0019817E61|nr:PAAR domain-containing protein [Paraburkholderia sp. Tr-20389]